MEGSGHFLVLAVGLNSQTGIIMSLLEQPEKMRTKQLIREEKKVYKKYFRIEIFIIWKKMYHNKSQIYF